MCDIVHELSLLNPKPNDVVVVTVPADLAQNNEKMHNLMLALQYAEVDIGADNFFLVLPDNVKIETLNPDYMKRLGWVRDSEWR